MNTKTIIKGITRAYSSFCNLRQKNEAPVEPSISKHRPEYRPSFRIERHFASLKAQIYNSSEVHWLCPPAAFQQKHPKLDR